MCTNFVFLSNENKYFVYEMTQPVRLFLSMNLAIEVNYIFLAYNKIIIVQDIVSIEIMELVDNILSQSTNHNENTKFNLLT